MGRPQFNLRQLLVAMLVFAAFFGGMAVQTALTRQELSDELNKIDKRAKETAEKESVLRMREAKLDAAERKADKTHPTEASSE
jgi:hypothetical protein